jgi:hypothetical protein
MGRLHGDYDCLKMGTQSPHVVQGSLLKREREATKLAKRQAKLSRRAEKSHESEAVPAMTPWVDPNRMRIEPTLDEETRCQRANAGRRITMQLNAKGVLRPPRRRRRPVNVRFAAPHRPRGLS